MPSREGAWYIFSRNTGLQKQAVIYKTKSLDAAPEVLIDPNEWSADGTVAIAGMSFTEDGRYLAYSKAVSGSDWQEWYVKDVATEQGPAGRHQVVEVQRRLLAEGRLRVLLQPLRRAEGRQPPAGREQEPEGVLPQGRHAAGPGRARLRAARQARLGLRRRGDRRRALPAPLPDRGHRQPEPDLRARPQGPEREDRAVPRRLRRRLQRGRQRRRRVLRGDQQPGAALPDGGRSIGSARRQRGVEDADSGGAGQGRARGRVDGERPVRDDVDDRRAHRRCGSTARTARS